MVSNYSTMHDQDGSRNGEGVILKEDYTVRVLDVKRVSGKLVHTKLDSYDNSGQCIGCMIEEKDKFWTDLDGFVREQGVESGDRGRLQWPCWRREQRRRGSIGKIIIW